MAIGAAEDDRSLGMHRRFIGLRMARDTARALHGRIRLGLIERRRRINRVVDFERVLAFRSVRDAACKGHGENRETDHEGRSKDRRQERLSTGCSFHLLGLSLVGTRGLLESLGMT